MTRALCMAPGAGYAALARHVLSNGMKAMVREDRRAPVVVPMVWSRTDSMDQSAGQIRDACPRRARPDRMVAELAGGAQTE